MHGVVIHVEYSTNHPLSFNYIIVDIMSRQSGTSTFFKTFIYSFICLLLCRYCHVLSNSSAAFLGGGGGRVIIFRDYAGMNAVIRLLENNSRKRNNICLSVMLFEF